MQEALSNKVITPGVTTGEDIAWWLEDQALAHGMTSEATTRVVRQGSVLPVHDPDIALLPGGHH